MGMGEERRQVLIEKLKRIVEDLEAGYGGFLYLYDELCEDDFNGSSR